MSNESLLKAIQLTQPSGLGRIYLLGPTLLPIILLQSIRIPGNKTFLVGRYPF
jgi:hypothetical protein